MRNAAATAVLIASLVAGCDLAPKFQTPPTPAPPPQYQDGGLWTPAAPADDKPRGAWWRVFGDATLDALEDRLAQGSARLASYVGRYDQAAASLRSARADLFPTATAQGDGERGKSLLYGDEKDYSGGVSVSYEVDLWGHVRNQVAASRSDAQASAADLAAIRLSLQAELAESYFRLRGADAQITLLRQTEDAYAKALDLTQRRYAGGAASEIDVDRAQTQLADAQAQREQAIAARSQYEHAIAALIGANPAGFTIGPKAALPDAPHIPLTAPSLLLQRRPDIAAAQRRVQAANARIGVARAAAYPSLTLGGSGGYETIAGTLVSASGLTWALGPAMSMLTLFDAGRNQAEVARTRGVLEEQGADYRQTVLDAFRDVEDQLVLVNRLAAAQTREEQAAAAAGRSEDLATIQYKDGAADYLQVVTAQTAAFEARRNAVSIATNRLAASVGLIRALGGGWRDNT